MTERQYPPFVYKGETVDETIGTLLDAVCRIDHVEEAAFFMAKYAEVNPHARENVGYLIGYLIGYIEPAERRQELYSLFMVKHPVSGGTP